MIQLPKDFAWEILKAMFQFLIAFWQLWAIPLIVLILILVFRYFFGKEEIRPGYQYQCRETLMTHSEHELFKILLEIVGGEYYVFPQVHLDAILNYKIRGQSWIGAFRHINEKSVDFVICDKQFEKPLLAIELDDRSHEREDRIARDLIVNNIFKNASFSLQRFNSKEALDKVLVKEKVLNLLIPQ
jgi:hypothetical protein